uniref:MYB family transcription factor n=1 Tax=Melilotus albus TaxID=47082 RepID=A0A896WD31_MELAB|nr:MYB family transcription factor [Melilotus albus]
MRRGIEVLYPCSYHHLENSNWLLQESKRITKWTLEENKLFENALALYDKDTPDRWMKVAEMIPSKTVGDVMKHYRDLEEDVSVIESGLIPFPMYTTTNIDEFNQFYSINSKSCHSNRPLEHERKKGVPWTKEEHRNISHDFVRTRTPTQVASHAQKYFIRQLNGGKDKRRSSIHDITMVSLMFNSENGNIFVAPLCDKYLYGSKLQEQCLLRDTLNVFQFGPYDTIMQM